MVKVVSTGRHPFPNGWVNKGEEVEVTAQEADVLVAIGRANRVATAKAEKQQVAEDADPAPAKQKRTYKRRDLTAE